MLRINRELTVRIVADVEMFEQEDGQARDDARPQADLRLQIRLPRRDRLPEMELGGRR